MMIEGFGSGHRPYGYGGDRRSVEIVSGGGTTARPPRPLDPSNGARLPGQALAAAAEKPWGFTDPEVKRKKRIARYKAYGVDGGVKASLRRGIGWIKQKCSQIVHS